MIDCSKTEDFVRVKIAMCKFYDGDCDKCELSFDNNGTGKYCHNFAFENYAEALVKMQNWADKNLKTYAEDFFEKFPNAPRNDDGMPLAHWCHVYGNKVCPINETCSDCWKCIKEVTP